MNARISRVRVAATAAAVAGALTLTACGGTTDDGADGAAEGGDKGAKVSVTDATGKKVEVPESPKRVLALSEMDLDSSLALGVKPVGLTAGRGQQGAPAYLAEQAAGIPVVGAVTGPDIEKVVEAKPDVILAGQMADEQVLEQLRAIAPTVVTIDDTKNWKKALEITGQVLGAENEAKTFLSDYDAKVEALEGKLGDKAGAEVSVARYSPKGTAVMQQGVFISDVLNDLGFKRPGIQKEKGEGHSTPLSDENLSEIDGDWLFIGTLTPADGTLLDELQAKPAFAQLDAVKSDSVTEIDGSKWTSLGGALAAVSVLEDIEKAMAE
ncbi:ABC transporter substrate-binding protein [Streptomyces sp. NPDC056600]|uniref:ABC transporter substrate-binding protein n=1 Tax=Streptomyces sp. NPDC056600 TaxID=3345874 RepID=UPI003689B1E9